MCPSNAAVEPALRRHQCLPVAVQHPADSASRLGAGRAVVHVAARVLLAVDHVFRMAEVLPAVGAASTDKVLMNELARSSSAANRTASCRCKDDPWPCSDRKAATDESCVAFRGGSERGVKSEPSVAWCKVTIQSKNLRRLTYYANVDDARQ